MPDVTDHFPAVCFRGVPDTCESVVKPRKLEDWSLAQGKHKFDKRVTVRVRDPDSCSLPDQMERVARGGPFNRSGQISTKP